jgi:two-component system sensor histidine kinase HydH
MGGSLETMTRKKKTTPEQGENERDLLRSILEHVMDGVFIADRDFRIEFMNQELRYQFGDGVGKRCYEFFGLGPTNCLSCREGMSTFGPPQRLEWCSRETRSTYDMVVSPLPNLEGSTSRLHILRDVSEQKRLEAEMIEYARALEERVAEQRRHLRRQERLAVLGEIASGLAHEIRTPLGALLTGIKLLEKDEPEGSDRRLVLSLLKDETLRLKNKLSEFLSYARRRQPALAQDRVADLLRESATLLAQDTELAGEARIVLEAAPDERPCSFDRALMKEVILNLATNSLQALNGKGKLLFRSFQAQGRQWLQVSDDGPGIPPEDLEQIFKPFFTRKRDGTGLGLAIVQGIVEDHGGSIQARSIPGRGATFTLSWPLSLDSAPTGSPPRLQGRPRNIS